MTGPQEPSIQPVLDSIKRQLTNTRARLRLWGPLHFVLLISGIAFPLIAAFMGGISVQTSKPILAPSDHPTSWSRTCAYMALFALLGALASALHKGLNAEQTYLPLHHKKDHLEKLREKCIVDPNPTRRRRELEEIIGE